MAVGLIAFIRHQPVIHTQVELGTLLKRLRTGVTYLQEHRAVWVFGLFSFSVFVGLLVSLNALMPLYVHNHLKAGAAVFGAAEVAYAAGALSAGLFVRRVNSIFIVVNVLLQTGFILLFSLRFSRWVPI